MKIFLVFLFSFFSGSLLAQDSWKVTFNDKQVLKTATEDAEKNVIRIPATLLLKKKDFCITFSEAEKKLKWDRSISVYNANDQEVYKQAGSKIKIKNGLLLNWFKKSGTLKVYTWALPADPKLKQVVRVRRIHLCTLVIEN